MNRRERRRAAKQRFVAKCRMCDADTCVLHVITRRGEKDLGICKGCPCSVGLCDSCGETGQHWLGCPAVGIEEEKLEEQVARREKPCADS